MDATSSSYGADQAGLICGFLFQPDVPARPIDSAAAAAWLDARAAEDEALREDGVERAPAGDEDDVDHAGPFVWLHFNLTHTGAEPWLARHARLTDTFFETLRDGIHSTRLERDEQALIAVVNDVHFDFSFEPSEISTLWISVDRRVVVTARRQPLKSIDQLRTAAKAGESMRSSVEVLERLLRAQADTLVGIVRGVTSRIDDVEDDLLAGRLLHKRIKLGALRRLLVRLQRLLAPEPSALFRLLQHPPGWMNETDVQELRQSTEEFSTVLRDMSGLQERIKLLQEEIAAQINEGNNRSLFVLTVVTVLALPINIIAGLLGMNVGGVPLAQHPHGFWVVVGLIATITAIAAWIAFFRKRDR